jgi:hypothetical protein
MLLHGEIGFGEAYVDRLCDSPDIVALIQLAIVCLAYPTARDLVSDRTPRLSVLQVDAHTDLRLEYEGSPYGRAA